MTTPNLIENGTDVATLRQEVAERPRMTYVDFFKERVEVTKAFCDSAKLYIQLSTAALVLPLVFAQTILGKDVIDKGLHVTGVGAWSLGVAWISFLLAIGSGGLYQWLVIRRMWDDLHGNEQHRAAFGELFHSGFRQTPWVPKFYSHNRSFWYGAMIVFFHVGAISFVVYASNILGLWSLFHR
jgi:hypothetical protein